MINIIKRSAVIALLLIMIPVPGALANTAENPSVEESSEQPVTEESTEQGDYEEPTEESVEGADGTTEEPSTEYVPPQNEQPQYESPTEAPYQSYEEPMEEFHYEEKTAEETVEEWTEESTVEVTEEVTEALPEEMTEEVPAEPEMVEEPTDVTINQVSVDEFSVAGEVVAEGAGLEDVTVVLLGEKEDEVTTDENGEFSFTEVPSGEYGLQVEAPEGYTAEKETLSLTVDDRGKRGVTFVMEEAPTEESIETDDQVMSDQDTEPTNNMTVILVGVVLLAIIAILFIVKALRR